MRNPALEVPFRTLAVRRRAEGDDPGLARAQMFSDVFDRAILAGGVAALEQNQDALALGDQMALELDQLDLQEAQGRAVFRLFVGLVGLARHAAPLLRGRDENRRPSQTHNSGKSAISAARSSVAASGRAQLRTGTPGTGWELPPISGFCPADGVIVRPERLPMCPLSVNCCSAIGDRERMSALFWMRASPPAKALVS